MAWRGVRQGVVVVVVVATHSADLQRGRLRPVAYLGFSKGGYGERAERE